MTTNAYDKATTTFKDADFFPQNESIFKSLLSMHFQYNVVQLSSSYIKRFDAMILEIK